MTNERDGARDARPASEGASGRAASALADIVGDAMWPRLSELLDRLLEADTGTRAQLIEQARREDPALAAAAEDLLQAHEQAAAGDFLATPVLQAWAPRAGQRLGAWELQSVLGEGGMGTVWLGRRADGRYESPVAIKFPNQLIGSPEAFERFRREGQILGTLHHPLIAALLDAGATPQGQPYLVMAYVEGERIDRHCDAQRWDLRQRVALIVRLLDAVDHAHRHLVVHRDLKPANVLVDADGTPHLLDFGIAKLVSADDTGDATLSRHGTPMTPGYAAPEQIVGASVSTSTDIYALGVVLYELLTGCHPAGPGAKDVEQQRRALLLDEVPPAFKALQGLTPAEQETIAAHRQSRPAQLVQALRGDLSALLSKCLAADPDQRYRSAHDLSIDLQAWLDGRPVLAREQSRRYRWSRWVKRNRRSVAAAGVAAVAASGLGLLAWDRHQAAQVQAAQSTAVGQLLQNVFAGMSPDTAAERRFSALELLDRAEAFLRAGGESASPIRGQTLWKMAELYEEVGAHDRSAKIYLEAEAEALARGDVAAQAEALLQLADAHLRSNDMAASKAALQRIPESVRHQPLVHARIETISGDHLLDEARLADAIAALERGQASLRLVSPPDALWWSRNAQVLGNALRRHHQLPAAREQFERSLQWHQRRLPRSHVDELLVQVDLASVDSWMGRYGQAATAMEPLLAELRNRLGAQRDHTVATACELAYAQMRSGNFERAGQLARQVIEETRTSPELQDLVNPMTLVLARIQSYRGEHAAAISAFGSALAAVEKRKGPVNSYTEPIRRILAEAHLRAGHDAEAMAILTRVEANQVRLSGDDHPTVAITRVLLGVAHARQGDPQAAMRLWKPALPSLQKQYGEEHPFMLVARAYGALAPEAPESERRQLAARLRRELAWQPGAGDLAERLENPAQHGMRWATLPVLL